MRQPSIEIFEMAGDVHPRFAVSVAHDRRRRPNLVGELLRNEGDVLRIHLTRGFVSNPRNLFHVRRHGLFRMAEKDADQRQVTLHAWPLS